MDALDNVMPLFQRAAINRKEKRNMFKNKRKRASLKDFIVPVLIVIITASGFLFGWAPVPFMEKNAVQAEAVEAKEGFAVVERVIDGDTFVIEGGERVRLIGCDTPESKHPDDSKNVEAGIVAAAYTKELLEDKEIYILLDVQERDRYGRILAYVYLPDGTFLNEHLLEEGYARTMTMPPNVAFKDLLIAAQNRARKAKKGIWQDYDACFPE